MSQSRACRCSSQNRLRRYAALRPPAARVPKSYLDVLLKGLPVQVDTVSKLTTAIHYQEERLGQFAEG